MSILLKNRPLRDTMTGLVALVLAWAFQDSLRNLSRDETAFIPEPTDYIGITIDPKITRRLLGIRLLAADLIWIDTLIKADVNREAKPFTAIYRSFRTMLELDPENVFAYYVAGMYLSVIKDDVKGATVILREGVQQLMSRGNIDDQSWRVPYALGYNLIFEENEVEEGSHWIEVAASMPSAWSVVKSMAKHLSTPEGRLDTQSKVLTDIYRHLTRPEEKKRIEEKLAEVAARQELLELNNKFRSYLSSTGAYSFPKARQLELFFRSIGSKRKDLLGRNLVLDAEGKIVPELKKTAE